MKYRYLNIEPKQSSQHEFWPCLTPESQSKEHGEIFEYFVLNIEPCVAIWHGRCGRYQILSPVLQQSVAQSNMERFYAILLVHGTCVT